MPAKPPEYLKLMLAVQKQIESTQDGLRDFRNVCRSLGHIEAFKLDQKRAEDVIHRLERKLIVKHNDYKKFVEILEIIGRDDVIRLLPGYEEYNSNKGDLGAITITDDQQSSILPYSDGTTTSHSQTGITDSQLQKLCDAISPNHERSLAIQLGFSMVQFERYKEVNRQSRVTRNGTFRMLIDWRQMLQEQGCSEHDQRTQLVYALTEAHMSDLVDICFANHGDSGISSRQENGPLSRDSIISDKQLSKLADRIGDGWSHFGIQKLGMQTSDIEHFREEENSVADSIFKMLHEWKKRQAGGATIGKLVVLMDQSEFISPDAFDFLLEDL